MHEYTTVQPCAAGDERRLDILADMGTTIITSAAANPDAPDLDEVIRTSASGDDAG